MEKLSILAYPVAFKSLVDGIFKLHRLAGLHKVHHLERLRNPRCVKFGNSCVYLVFSGHSHFV